MDTVVIERLAILETKAKAAHDRLDRMEAGTREDLLEIKHSLHLISSELKSVMHWIERAKGWAAALLLMGGVVGGLGAIVLRWLLQSSSV